MLIELVPVNELFIAQVAFMWLVFIVAENVGFEILRLGEFLRAYLARVQFLDGMAADMIVQKRYVGKLCAAHIAEMLIFIMGEQVLIERIFPHVLLPTQIAFMRLIVRMTEQVLLEVIFPIERFVAEVAWKRFLSGMHQIMLLHLVASNKLLVALAAFVWQFP